MKPISKKKYSQTESERQAFSKDIFNQRINRHNSINDTYN